mmetsp:Transcript_12899/g.24549  ORF Transcript_12899/g.24549 Transcript_12899/m.24549 type:complete len:210 (-) Transcript_12899:516-1145(-)
MLDPKVATSQNGCQLCYCTVQPFVLSSSAFSARFAACGALWRKWSSKMWASSPKLTAAPWAFACSHFSRHYPQQAARAVQPRGASPPQTHQGPLCAAWATARCSSQARPETAPAAASAAGGWSDWLRRGPTGTTPALRNPASTRSSDDGAVSSRSRLLTAAAAPPRTAAAPQSPRRRQTTCPPRDDTPCFGPGSGTRIALLQKASSATL